MDRSIKPRLFFVAFGWLLVSTPATHAQDENTYLRGYVDALLDSRYAGLGLKALAADAAGRVTLGARTCLGPSQKRDIELLLQQTGKVKRSM